MPILSRRNAPKLLRSVNNRPHASAEDHDDAPRRGNMTQAGKPQTKDIDILADPVSSGDEEEQPPAPPSASTPPPLSMSQDSNASTRSGTRSARGANGSGSQGKRAKAKGVRAPQRGAFGAGLRRKDNSGKDEGKENTQEVDPIYFSMGDTPRRKQKTKNVHAAPVGFNRKSFGKNKPGNTFSIPKTRDVKHIDDLDNALSKMLDDHERYVEVSDDEHSPPPKKRARTIQRLPPGYATSSNPTTTKDLQTSAPSSPLTPVSSHLDDIHTSTQDPEQDPDSICALCQDSVDAQEQRDFWTTHPTRTVRDQMLFCKAHKRSKAQREYTARGFPEVDWALLPSRIRGFQAELVAILRNETADESFYRAKHAERLGSGKAAALPSKRRRRKDASEVVERGMKDRIDATTSSTGYYGPRGRRVMMDVITSDLSDEIRDVAAKDPVVGRSGFAMFLQAVLVPECAVLLVMQDLGVDVGAARGVLEESAEVGDCVNEEVEDEVEGSEGEAEAEAEQEYGEEGEEEEEEEEEKEDGEEDEDDY